MSSENNHWSMKDREDWTQDDWDQFQKETTYCEVEEAVENILPAILDWSELREMQAKNHPNWYKNLGKCTSLIFKVYQQQKGLESQVNDFMFCVEKFAIGVTLDDAPLNLDQAYEVCGYVRVPKLPRKNVDPVPF